MKKYLFFTYGEPGWRGVQVRGVRVASYFPKDEVLFWNGGDSQFIKEAGFEVKTVDLGLISPSYIKFPGGIKVVIFCDLPTNEFFQFSLLTSAKKKGLPVVVLEQLYRRRQTKEFVYKKLIDYCDLFILNGLSFAKGEESEKVKIVPPLVEFEPEDNSKEILSEKWELPADVPWFFGVGYKEEVLTKIKNIAQKLKEQGLPFWFIASGERKEKEMIRKTNLTILPYQIGDDYYRFIKAAEVVFTKLGFLQILEVLALGKTVVVLGGGGYVLQRKEVIDQRIKEAIFFADGENSLVGYIKSYLSDSNWRNGLIRKVASLHDGSLFGGEKIASYIKELEKRQGKVAVLPKKLIILVNEELIEYQGLVTKTAGVYVLGFLLSTPVGPYIVKRPNEEILNTPIIKLLPEQKEEILPHYFGELYLFSKRKYDGLVEILPWYKEWIEGLEKKLNFADDIYISRKSYPMFKNLLSGFENKIKFLV